jgi:hypothetical protein
VAIIVSCRQARGERLDLLTRDKGGDDVTVLEVIALLNLLAVVIFGVGVINVMKKK